LRRSAAVVLGTACVALLLAAATAGAALLEPVAITATAPEPQKEAGRPFKLEVAVEAEAGALDIAVRPLRVRVKLAPECGGSFAGTAGPAAYEATLAGPPAGAALSQTLSGKVTAPSAETEVVCAFLEDATERQFATDTEEEVTVLPAGAVRQCTVATKQLRKAKKGLKRLEHRIVKVKKQVKKAHGAHRRALVRKLHKLRTHERRAKKRRQAAARKVTGVCG
jgi:hypothetical protein